MSQGVNLNEEGVPFPLGHDELELEPHGARDPIISLLNGALGLPRASPRLCGCPGHGRDFERGIPTARRLSQEVRRDLLKYPECAPVQLCAVPSRTIPLNARNTLPDRILSSYLSQSQRRKQAQWPVEVPPQQSCACTQAEGVGAAGLGSLRLLLIKPSFSLSALQHRVEQKQVYRCEYTKLFILVLLLINYCVIFHTNNGKPCIYTHITTVGSPNNLAMWAGQAQHLPLRGKKTKPGERWALSKMGPAFPAQAKGRGREGRGAIPLSSHQAALPCPG